MDLKEIGPHSLQWNFHSVTTDRQTETHRHRHTNRQTDRETNRETERERDRERDRERLLILLLAAVQKRYE